MKALVWDNGFLGKSEGNIVRKLHAVYPDYVEVEMLDGQIFSYHNAVSINKLHCRKCKVRIREDHIGKESRNVSNGYTGACHKCDEDMYLFELLHNEPKVKNVI